jgi:hypothetical protein
MPEGIKQAIIAIWVTIGLSIMSSIINVRIGSISEGIFVAYLLTYSLLCIFPYKLGKGSNPSRWIYCILVVFSVLMLLGGGVSEVPRADLIISIICIPIQAFVIYRLFQPEASEWFKYI